MTRAASEPTISLPTGRLVAVCTAVPALAAAAWAAGAAALSADAPTVAAGAAAAVAVAVAKVAGLLVATPWRPRLAGDCMNMWLAATVVRMLLSIGLAFLLYSATPIPATPLALAVGLVYLVTLFVEAGVLTRYLHRVLPEP